MSGSGSDAVLKRSGLCAATIARSPRCAQCCLQDLAMVLLGWSRCLALESLGYPDLDDRLPGHAQPLGLTVQRLDHPRWKVHVYAALLLPRAACFGEVELRGHILARVELAIEILSFHRW